MELCSGPQNALELSIYTSHSIVYCLTCRAREASAGRLVSSLSLSLPLPSAQANSIVRSVWIRGH